MKRLFNYIKTTKLWALLMLPILLIIRLVVGIRYRAIRALLHLRARLQQATLRTAIYNADKDKEKTGRKNMVVFNSTQGVYEPVQKKLLKRIAKAKKPQAIRNGYRTAKAEKKAPISIHRVKVIENKSLYVTK